MRWMTWKVLLLSGVNYNANRASRMIRFINPSPSFYRYVLAFIFAIDEINKNPYILPNVTLGYHVTDSCNNEYKAIENLLQILSGPGDMVPNYSCLSNGKLVGVVGDQSSKTSIQIIEHLNVYGYTQ
ncbi:unnamed protein product, partial [Ranitomeya imitator]